MKAGYGRLEIVLGRRKETIGLADTSLGTGAFIWSGNALPIPQLQVSIPAFTPVPFTAGILSIQGSFSHGWFNNLGPVTHSYLHRKTLYGRLSPPGWPVRFYAGFNHQVQWGGRSDVLQDTTIIKRGRFPDRFPDYVNVVTGASLGYDKTVDTARYSFVDRYNRIGNHLGTIDLGIEADLGSFSLFLYRQSIYEDGSLYYLINIADGLNGIRLRNLRSASKLWQIKSIVLDFLHTKSQGGPKFGDKDWERGADNYFNHSQYIDGWSYGGQAIGTPFMTPAADSRAELPRYQTRGKTGFFNNNRVKVFHLGLEGFYKNRYGIRLKVSVSENWGTYPAPFQKPVRQVSLWCSAGGPVKLFGTTQADISLSADRGKLYRSTTAIQIRLRKDLEWTVRR